MKKGISIILSMCILLSFFGCAKIPENVSSDTSSKITYQETTSGIAQPEIDGEFTFAFNPYVVSEEAVQGMKGTEYYNRFVRAVINRSSSVSVPTREDYDNIRFAIGEFFPFISLIESFRYSSVDKAILINYSFEQEKHNQLISDFKSEIENIFSQCIEKSDDSTIAALSLYKWVATNISVIENKSEKVNENDVVSSGIAKNEVSSNVSSTEETQSTKSDIYNTLINKEGTEYSVAALYNFLIKQLGIEGKTVSAWNEGKYRSWNMICLKNKWYHCDILSEQKKTKGEGLSCFGLTKKEISELLKVEEICTGEWSWFTEKTPKSTSDRFEDFRNVESWAVLSTRKGIEAFTVEFSRFVWEI